jgi:hypothetical protein
MEYVRTIADVFGADILVKGRFEPEQRVSGLLAVGDYAARMSNDGLEHYEDLARSIAAQVVDPTRRHTLFSCVPRNPHHSDDACAGTFLAATGRYLFRRPLEERELAARVKTANIIADQEGDFYAGIAVALTDMLVSPAFLYHLNQAEPDPAHPGQYRLDSYSRAALLSSYLWGTAPDNELLRSAATGELLTATGLARQVNRMISSPKVEGGVRSFFWDMLGFEQFDGLTKDPQFFPSTTTTVIAEAPEQTLRTIVDLLVRHHGDYRDLFTTRATFLTRSLATVYGVPLQDGADIGQPDRWVPYTYAEGDPRAGILSQLSFVGLHSPAGRSSPTDRGKALRELILCEKVPPPPANVDFKFVTDTTNPVLRTTRDRLTAHRTNPVCAGCHKLTDPLGLALENFDGGGAFRTEENGVTIDTSGELGGRSFQGPRGLADAIRDDPALTSCVARRSFAYAAGRAPSADGPQWQKIAAGFQESGYNVVTLMRQVALSPLLYAVPSSELNSAP